MVIAPAGTTAEKVAMEQPVITAGKRINVVMDGLMDFFIAVFRSSFLHILDS